MEWRPLDFVAPDDGNDYRQLPFPHRSECGR
jgi:hypothetical protein